MLPRTRVSTSLSNFFRWGVERGRSPYPTFFRLGQSHFPTFFGSAKVGSRLFSARRNWDFDFFRHEPEMGLCHISESRAPEFRGSPAPEFRSSGESRLLVTRVHGDQIIPLLSNLRDNLVTSYGDQIIQILYISGRIWSLVMVTRFSEYCIFKGQSGH